MNFLIPLSFLVIVFYACGGDYAPPEEMDQNGLNLKIRRAVQDNAAWARTPQSIVKELFPKRVRNYSNSVYSISEDRLSDNALRIIISEEGDLDDEVSGERTVLDFHYIEGKWLIDEMSRSVKWSNR